MKKRSFVGRFSGEDESNALLGTPPTTESSTSASTQATAAASNWANAPTVAIQAAASAESASAEQAAPPPVVQLEAFTLSWDDICKLPASAFSDVPTLAARPAIGVPVNYSALAPSVEQHSVDQIAELLPTLEVPEQALPPLVFEGEVVCELPTGLGPTLGVGPRGIPVVEAAVQGGEPILAAAFTLDWDDVCKMPLSTGPMLQAGPRGVPAFAAETQGGEPTQAVEFAFDWEELCKMPVPDGPMLSHTVINLPVEYSVI